MVWFEYMKCKLLDGKSHSLATSNPRTRLWSICWPRCYSPPPPLCLVSDHHRIDEEIAAKNAAQKALREMQNQNTELQEDLDAERACRSKAEKQKKDMNEVGHAR